MKRIRKQLTSCFLMICILISGMYFWGQETGNCPYEEFIVVDVFDNLANYQGIQSGWFAKLVRDRFNMELNIIAPNVAGGGETLFETRSAAGNLGDLIICNGENGSLQEMVSAGLVLDMNDYLEGKQIMRFEEAIRLMNDAVSEGSIFAIPSELSANAPTVPRETVEPTYCPYIRWDLYKELGYPEIETMEELLPILLQMQELEPIAENEEKTYGFSFFRDWDANLMNAAKQPCCIYGYDEYGFVLVKADGSDFQSVADSDSLYIRTLKWYFTANQMGLVDPESRTQNLERVAEKYEAGQIFFSPWPWLSKPQYNTASRKSQGKGYMAADIADMQIYSYGCSKEGNYHTVIAIGSQAKDPGRLADFIDWLYSAEGISTICANDMFGSAGPEGLCWNYEEDGPHLTEFGKLALMGGEADVPEAWGGGTWKEGICRLNYTPVSKSDLDDRGFPYLFQQWDSVKEIEETPLEADWHNRMNASTTMEYLTQNQKVLVSPGCGYTAREESAEETTIRRQCSNAIRKYSWNMIFAENEAEFDRLLEEMQNELRSLGYDGLLEFDMENAKEREVKRWENVENSGYFVPEK